MAFYDHLAHWRGYRVEDFDLAAPQRPDADGVIYRLAHQSSERGGFLWRKITREEIKIGQVIARFANQPGADRSPGLIIGAWEPGEEAEVAIAPLIEHRRRLAALRCLFLGEFTQEENEVSWILQSDFAPLLEAFPGLAHFAVRGVPVLGKPVRHEGLRSLTLQSPGTPKDVVNQLRQSVFPELEELDIYTGTEDYGGEIEPDDLRWLLFDNPFPKLRRLGIRNCEVIDALAPMLADAPVLDQIEELDLSLGTLSDKGAEALLASPRLAKLKQIDLHHHYMSEPMMARWQALGVKVDVGDRQEDEEFDGEPMRAVAIAE